MFISLVDFDSIKSHGLYSDLLREFVKNGHDITIVSPNERRTKKKTICFDEKNVRFIKPLIGNIQKTNFFEKGISTMLLSAQLSGAIKKYCNDKQFDLILYATPPITIYSVIKKLKMITNAKTCLMLKDIWPQEMVDLGLIRPNGILVRYFARLERKLYNVSDLIGYSSKANKEYLLKNNIDENKLIPVNNSVDATYNKGFLLDRKKFLNDHGIDYDGRVFFYGGNLGKPQDIDFLLRCLKTQLPYKDRFFVICGQGTEYSKIERFFEEEKPKNMKLFPFLPKDVYDEFIMAADVGMIFLNRRFTVPNCPSRFYTYMEYSKPIIACTDCTTDIKDDIIDGEFGWWMESSSQHNFMQIINQICQCSENEILAMGKKARQYLEKKYTVDRDYDSIVKALEKL